MRDPTKKGNIAYEAGMDAAEYFRKHCWDTVDWGNELEVDDAIYGFEDRIDEIVDMDAEDRRDA